MPRRAARSLPWLLVLLLAVMIGSRPATAGNGGEARSILREPDRPYGVVAGEADASAVVQNPANLGYLQGFNAVLDFSFNIAAAGRRGNGLGVFAAMPLPFKFLALGLGVQGMFRAQAQAGGGNYATADDAYGKFTVAAAVPLMRWAPGLSLGFQYSRLFSSTNVLASGTNQFDLALSWRANRFASLALVARNLNSPRLTQAGRMAAVLDPEIALRPFGDPRLEFAIGMRTRFGATASPQVLEFPLQPRGRVLFGTRGVRIFAEVERVAYFTEFDADPFDAVRVNAGLQFDSPHFGVAAGPNFGFGTRGTEGLHGASGRIRASQERYTEVLPVRPRRITRISLAGKGNDRELADIVWTIDELARRRGGVVLVELRGSGFRLPQLEELREALLRFRDAGGKVVAYLEGGGVSQYFVASVADRILAHPHTPLSITGFSTRTFYWGELIERLGAKAEFVRVAEYKGTPEVFSRSAPSSPVAEANRALLTDVWNHAVRIIGRGRARDPAVVSGWIDEAPWQPAQARARGLVDELAWPDEIDAKLEAWLGRRVRIEAPPSAPVRPGDWRDPAHVAILHISGNLVVGESAVLPLLDVELAGSVTLTREIAKLRDDRDVKAVVVRIDSRGGSLLASEEIARELDLLRERKPVVISMGSVAASGGYHVATAGQYIYANATTMTGSIGVFMPKIDLSGFLEKVGVNVDILAIGDRATLRSWWKPYGDDERVAVLAGLQVSYDRFIERVAAARAMTPEAASAVARGRIWSGARAIEVGLVDRYGGMHEAADRAAQMAGLQSRGGAGVMVLHYPAPPTLVERIRTLFGLSIPLPLGAAGERGFGQIDPMTGRALSFADPVLRALRLLPASLWLSAGPEPLALGPCEVEIDG
ncbi:MAG TPA: signal peptide peptidase SppA [Enhygromyxa sp.]|nr:signal peptide peptidase SppA [Enhygromyxa sp.]